MDIEKYVQLFAGNGLELQITCGACPEQYDVFKDDKQVAYFRLRHGTFRVDMPDCGDDTVLSVEPEGDGIFEENEREYYLTLAMNTVLENLKKPQ